jgi:hypothetical protein
VLFRHHSGRTSDLYLLWPCDSGRSPKAGFNEVSRLSKAVRVRKLPLHLVPTEIEWQNPDGSPLAVTELDLFARITLAEEMRHSKQSFETTARRALRIGLRLLLKKRAA